MGVVGGACSDVSQSFFEVAQFAKREKLVSILQDLQASGEASEKTLIFVEQKKNADFLATYLCQADVSMINRPILAPSFDYNISFIHFSFPPHLSTETGCNASVKRRWPTSR